MKNLFDTYKPEGFHTVTSYIFAEKPQQLIEFLESTFDAKAINRSLTSDGKIANVILKIGDTCFMISQARGRFVNMKTAFYLYVDDVDAVHKRALENGATLEFDPLEMSYGDYQSGIIDPCGNYWWISKRLVEKGYHE